MSKINSGLKGLVLLVIASSALFLTCDVGLGDSVDTKPPAVTITYPPVQSVIKNTFTMSGAASDDTSLASVNVSMVNTVTSAIYGPYAAKIDATTTSWSLVVNNKGPSGFEIRDGTYEMTVTALDSAGRKSVVTTTYEIDNTAPIVVIDRPGTYGVPAVPLASQTTEVYGTELKLTGSINDDHSIDKLVFTVYDSAGNVVGSPISQTNISGVGMDVTLARFSASPTTAEEVLLDNLYRAIHTAADDVTQKFYCTITVSDAAREYNPPAAVASVDNTRGNVNSSYYIYDDIYSTIFSATGYAVTMKDLTAMFNGSYSNAAKSAAVLGALALKAHPATTWSPASATFSLNPTANPTFTVQGYDPLAGQDSSMVWSIDKPAYQKADETDLTIFIHAGRDGVPLDKDTFKIYLVPCGTGATSETAAGPAITPALLPTLAECGGDAGLIAARDAQISTSGTDYSILVRVDGEANTNYLLKVEGADKSGNAIADTKFGFKVVINGLPPTISIATPTLNSYSVATTGSHTVTLSGTVTSENGTPSLTLTGYTETKVNGTKSTVVDNADSGTYVPITLTASGTTNEWNWSYPIDTTHNLSVANGGGGEDLYTYDMILRATNSTSTPAQATCVFFVDSAPPTAELVSYTPYVTVGPTAYVNGNVWVNLRFADNDRIASATYRLGTDPVQTITTLNGINIGPIDTRNYDGPSEDGMLPLSVTLTDRAGLQTTYRTDDLATPAWVINIDQSLDKPTLALNYANPAVTTAGGINATTNLYGRDGYTAINGTVTDDDGIASVYVYIDTIAHAATVTGSTFSYSLSGLTPGYHDVRITATDNALGASTSVPGPASTFMIAYDTDLPSIVINNADNQFQSGAFQITGQRTDNSGISSFTCSPSGTIVPDVASAWHVDIAKPAASETTTLTFTAKDLYGRTATKTFTYKYDLDSPTIGVTTALNAQPGRNYFNQNYAMTIKGTAAEAVSANAQSGLAGIEYTTVTGLNASLTGSPTWIPATGSASWVANVDITDGGTYADGDYTVFIRSVDLMGNVSTPVSYTITGDRVAPTLDETAINTTNTVYKPSAFTLGGPVSDTGSGLASFSYKRNGGASVDLMPSISGGIWTLNENSVPDGTYTYVFTAKDRAGISSTVTRTVTIDSTNPLCSFSSPAADNAYILADSYNFKGSATDPGAGSGVGTINLTINGVDTAISPVSSWSSVQDLTSLTEGTLYTAHLAVTDNAGNGATADRTFKVDRADPRATIAAGAPVHAALDSGSTYYRETAFSLSGTCDDATLTTGRKATSVVLSRSKDGAAATKIASTVLADGVPFGTNVITNQAWTYAQAVNAATHADDGLYVYTLVVTDDAGRTVTATATVRIDTTAPTVIVTAPSSGEAVNVSSYTLQGNASDLGSGINTATLQYTLDGGPATALSLSGATWTAASVSLGAEGSKALVVSCADKLGNAITPINVTFYYDLNKPELTEATIGSSTLITRLGFALGGKCLDTNQMKQIDISATRAAVTVPKTWTWPTITKSGTNTLENWTQNVALTDLDYEGTTNGTYTFTIVATDIAGKTTTVQRTVIVDTVAPTISGVTDLRYVTAGWLRTSTRTVTGTVTDPAGGSGIDTVQYAVVTDGTLDTEPWYSMTVSGTTFTGSISFADGVTNQLYIRATDRATNYQQNPQGMIWVDSMAPTLSVDSPIGVTTVNGKNNLPITVSVNDATSALGSVSASFTTDSDPYNAPDTWSEIASAVSAAGSATVTIPAASLNTLAEGSGKVYLRIPDGAGNYSTVATVNLLVDKTAPTGSVTSHADVATVNKVITISGTATDANGVASVTSLEVWTGGAGTTDPDPEATTGWTAASATVTGTYGWSASGLDTALYGAAADARSNIAGIQLCVRVAVTDTSGNVGHVMRKLTVDQDSDRPVIKMSNVNPDGTTTLKLSGVVYGTITDDDGVTLLEVSTTGTFSAGSSDDVTVDGGSWSFDAGGTDGLKELYFRVTDSKGTMFTTVKADDASILAEPKIQYQSTYFSSSVTYRVDTIAPETSGPWPVVIDRTSAYDFGDATLISTNMPLGGGSGGAYSRFLLRVLAKDANGIASVVATVPGLGSVSLLPNGTDGTDPSFTRFDSDSNVGTVGVFEPVDISGLTDAAITIAIVITDNSGLTTTLNRTVLIDNTKPSVTHSSPRNDNTTDVVNGDAVVKGVSDDGASGSGVMSLKYQTGLTADRAANSALWKPVGGTLFSWQIDYKAGVGTGIDGNKIDIYGGQSVTLNVGTDTFTLAGHGYATGTAVYFGGGGTLPDTGTPTPATMDVTVPYYVINTGTDTFKVAASYADAIASTPVPVDLSGSYTSELSVSKFSKDVNNNGLWELPILLRAEDNAGNVLIEDYTTYIVHVDPSGDRPRISIVYPDPAASNRTMGGTIRIFGTATDDDAVGAVYMQIDANGDGLYDASDNNYNGSTTAWYNGGVGQAVSGTASWNQTINSTFEFNPKTASVSTIKTGVSYRIVTPGDTTFTGGGGFGAASNLAGTEFVATRDGTAGDGTGWIEPLTRTIHFRVRAQDIYNVYGAWSASQTIVVDKNVPKIGSTEQLGMTQGATNRTYVADMYVKGNWTFTGSIEDESGISEVTVSSSVPALNGTLATAGWFTSESNFGTGNSGYRMSIPITTSGTGSLSFTITATDNSDPKLSSSITININYDNEAPTLNAYTGATPVVQSNKVYSLVSSVNEAGSGFDKLAFYFERNVATNSLDRIYNPMEARTGDANRTYLNTLTTVEGLPALQITGATRGTDRSLTSGSIVGNYNVRKGGLVNIGGIWQNIISVNYGSGTITWADAVDVSVTSASVAYAMVVNNTTVETPVWTGSTLTNIINDDGDFMVEAVERSGGLYNWTASIDSTNIPDGPIEIHYVAFDKAGNYVTGLVSTSVQNNRPKIASVILGTDLNGDGDTDDPDDVNETATYSALDGSNNPQAVVSILSSAFIAKGLTTVTPTIIGGNGELQYTLKVGGNTIHNLAMIRADEVSPVGTITVTEAQLLAGTIGEGNKSFLFTIWDSTEETTPGSTSQYAELTVPLVVDAVDGVVPKNAVSPFFWTAEASGSNSLYQGSRANGHIEITGVYGGTDPDVSGKVSIRGTAYDDQRIDEVYAHIDGMAMGSPVTAIDTVNYIFTVTQHGYKVGDQVYFAGTTLPTGITAGTAYYVITANHGANQFSVSTSKGGAIRAVTGAYGGVSVVSRYPTGAGSTNEDYMLIGSYTSGAWTASADRMTAQGLAPSVSTASIDQTGHRVAWQLDWDSSFVSGVAAADRVIKIVTVDRGGNLSSYTSGGTVGNDTTYNEPTYQVDVVPYIHDLTRSANATRSRLGKYPLRDSETDVTINGFNILMPTTQDANNWVRIYSASTAGNADADGLTVQATPTASSFQITLNADSNSGYLRLAVNGIEAINNIDDNGKAYNKEISTSSPVYTAAWNDDRYLVLFRTGDYFSQSLDPEYASMSFDSTNGNLVGEWSNSGYAATYYGTPVADGNTRNTVFSTFDPPTWTDIYVDADAQRHSLILRDYNDGGTDWGYLSTYIGTGSLVNIERLGDDNPGSPAYADGMDEKLHQFQNGRIAVRGGTNDQYASYYDTFGKCLKYGRMLNGAQTYVAANGHQSDSLTVVDGVDDFSVTTTDPDVGIWSDIQVDDIGGTDTTGWRPVIVYYDTTNERLKIARGNSSTPSGTAQWTIQVIPNSSYMGDSSLSMKIDTGGNLHIVTRNSMEGGVYYIYAANVNGTASYTFSDPVLVDPETGDGSWCDITLNGTRPYICYKNGTSYKGLKYAYVASGTGTSAGDWEYMIVPTATTVPNGRMNIEYATSATAFPYDGNVAFGYASSYFQIVYLRREVP